MKQRVLVLGDMHCGHLVGLTPPAWQLPIKRRDTTKRNKFAKIQKELWDTYESLLEELRPIHCVLFGGDAIDGKGPRSGSTELITASREEQCDMATAALDHIKIFGQKGRRLQFVGVYGTPYHTGASEDWENDVAKSVGFVKIGAHEWPEVEGVVFDLKHKIGRSTIPHGIYTPLARDMLWNELWAMEAQQPRAQVMLRFHAHYYAHAGDRSKSAFICPALQGMGSKYGARQCSNIVDWGLMHFDCKDGRVVDWDKHIVAIEAQSAKPTRL